MSFSKNFLQTSVVSDFITINFKIALSKTNILIIFFSPSLFSSRLQHKYIILRREIDEILSTKREKKKKENEIDVTRYKGRVKKDPCSAGSTIYQEKGVVYNYREKGDKKE